MRTCLVVSLSALSLFITPPDIAQLPPEFVLRSKANALHWQGDWVRPASVSECTNAGFKSVLMSAKTLMSRTCKTWKLCFLSNKLGFWVKLVSGSWSRECGTFIGSQERPQMSVTRLGGGQASPASVYVTDWSSCETSGWSKQNRTSSESLWPDSYSCSPNSELPLSKSYRKRSSTEKSLKPKGQWKWFVKYLEKLKNSDLFPTLKRQILLIQIIIMGELSNLKLQILVYRMSYIPEITLHWDLHNSKLYTCKLYILQVLLIF